MSHALQRGMLLYNQGRYDLAEAEFRRGLDESPDDPLSHAFLALCALQRGRKDDAVSEAREAIRLDPGLGFAHYVMGAALLGHKRPDEAEAAAREAVRIEPDNADYRLLRGQVAMDRRLWGDALAAADEGLALDAQHGGCRNLRAMALTQMGRKKEAAETLGEALADDPDDAFTHANQGWVDLHRGDPRQALEHFREALRLEPNNEWARAGIVEALKARHLIYRVMLRFFLWMGRLGRGAQWAVILGFLFGRRILAEVGKANPALAPFIAPILILSFAFLMLTWIASPLFNFLLRFNRFGRLALSDEQKTEAAWIGGAFLIAVAGLAVYFATGSDAAFLAAFTAGFLLFPLRVTFQAAPGRTRWLLAAGTAGLLLFMVPTFSLILLGPTGPFRDAARAEAGMMNFLLGCVASTWIQALLGSRLRGG